MLRQTKASTSENVASDFLYHAGRTGKPHRFYRGFNNLKLSPVSREIAGVSMFYTGLLDYVVFGLWGVGLLDVIANGFAFVGVLSGAIGLYYMYKLYRIPARPFWNHWQTGTAFVGTMLSFGALLVAVASVIILPLAGIQALLHALAVVMFIGLAVEGYGHIAHARDMDGASHEGAASYYHQVTEYGKSYQLRNGLLVFNLGLVAVIAVLGLSGFIGYLAGLLLLSSMLVMAAFGRSLFFVLVIPTTMPGAFFWKNKGFVEHARATGLADAPQHGVAYERHHAFKVDELIKTIKETSVKEVVEHVRGIFGG